MNNHEAARRRETEASNESLRQLIEALPMIVFTSGAEGNVEYYNQKWFDYIGQRSETYDYQNWPDVIHPDDLPALNEKWQNAKKTGEIFVCEYRIRRKDGVFRWHLCRSMPVKNRDGRVTKWIGSVTDIDDLKAVQSSLEKSEQRYRAVINNAPVIIWSVDKDGTITLSEGKGLEPLHLKPGELVGKSQFAVFADRPDMNEYVRRALRGEAFAVDIESGGLSYETHYAPIQTSEGEITGMVAVSTNVTERKKALAEMRQAMQTAELANQAKTNFLANMSHEIRTPLGAILGFAEMLQDPELSATDRSEYIEIIERSGRALTQIIDDILDISKIEADRLRIEKLPISLRELMKDVISLLEVIAERKSLDLKISYDVDVPEHIITDPVRLRQILINIIGNGIKFTSKGGVYITVRRLEGGNESQEMIGFYVKDTGTGITPEAARSLFQPFQQADNSMTRKYGGTGLGLALSKRLALALGGDVSLAESVVGKGSTFLISISADVAEQSLSTATRQTDSNQQKPPKIENLNLAGVRVLLIEDSADNRLLIQRMLTKRGAVVQTAENGKVGVDRAIGQDFDVLLMDIQMPVMNGYQATIELRSRHYQKPIIALTAHALKEERERCLRVGCTDYLSKPVDQQKLFEVIAQYAPHPREQKI